MTIQPKPAPSVYCPTCHVTFTGDAAKRHMPFLPPKTPRPNRRRNRR